MRNTRLSTPTGCNTDWFCDQYRAWAAEGRPGDAPGAPRRRKLFIDYAGQTVPVVDRETGEERDAQVLVAVLGASSYAFAARRPGRRPCLTERPRTCAPLKSGYATRVESVRSKRRLRSSHSRTCSTGHKSRHPHERECRCSPSRNRRNVAPRVFDGAQFGEDSVLPRFVLRRSGRPVVAFRMSPAIARAWPRFQA